MLVDVKKGNNLMTRVMNEKIREGQEYRYFCDYIMEVQEILLLWCEAEQICFDGIWSGDVSLKAKQFLCYYNNELLNDICFITKEDIDKIYSIAVYYKTSELFLLKFEDDMSETEKLKVKEMLLFIFRNYLKDMR